MRFLIVDDSGATRRLVRRVLRHAGHDETDINEAENGEEALASIQLHLPDVVISDWHMPVMSGIELLRTLHRQGIEVKFGFISSAQTSEMLAQAELEGALFILMKPFTMDSYRQVLSAII